MERRFELFNGEIRHRCEDNILRTLPCIRCGIYAPHEGEKIMAEPKDMRTFETGATRDQDTTKIDPEAFYSPLVVERFAQYLHKHRKQADGSVREGDNWQKGMPLPVYIKSAWRHFLAWWKAHRGYQTEEDIEESLCALIFNAQGYLFELLKAKQPVTIIGVKPGQKITLGQFAMPNDDPALLLGLPAGTKIGRL